MKLPLVVIIGAAAVLASSGCTRGLPPSAETLVVRCLHAKKVVSSRETRQRTVGEFDYFGISITLEIDSSFENWYHSAVILRKQHSDKDWSRAELFSHETLSTIQVFDLPDEHFCASSTRGHANRPNHPMERTTGRLGSTLSMKFHPQPAATRSPASRRSSYSR
jgi:hypothetical protein